jgi:hypothetical protein
MVNFKDDILPVLLAGGLPNAIDYGNRTTPNSEAMGDARPEETAPSGTIEDREPYLQRALLNVTQTQILVATAAIVGVLGIVYLARR